MTDAKRAAFTAAVGSSPFVRAAKLYAARLNDYDIRELLDSGSIARETRGVYRVGGSLPEGASGSELALLFSLVPGGVLCLESALAWHIPLLCAARAACLAL